MGKKEVLARIRALGIKDIVFTANFNKWDKKYVLIKHNGMYEVFYFHEYKQKERSFNDCDEAYDYLYKIYGGDSRYHENRNREEIMSIYDKEKILPMLLCNFGALCFLALSLYLVFTDIVLGIVSLALGLFLIVLGIFVKKVVHKHHLEDKEILYSIQSDYIMKNPAGLIDNVYLAYVNDEIKPYFYEHAKVTNIDYDIEEGYFSIYVDLEYNDNEYFVVYLDNSFYIDDKEFKYEKYNITCVDELFTCTINQLELIAKEEE